MNLPYWLSIALPVLALLTGLYTLSGLPLALLLLPRSHWWQRGTLALLTLIAGPTVLTGWMFIIGTAGGAQQHPLMTLETSLAGWMLITLLAWLAVWRKIRVTTPAPHPEAQTPLTIDERLLTLLIVIAVLLRFLTTAYWTFTAYDALWVFGYNARLFYLNTWIPPEIDYYPQFIPLQFTFAQFLAGMMNDHAARMVIPLMHAGSILAAYVAGTRLFNRRTGFYTAALWTLYPHVGEWAHIGDLEIPLAFLFTASATFFLLAWTDPERTLRRRYALIAGLVFGVTMWTKPTGGAFIWGVLLLLLIDLIRVRGNLRQWWTRFEVAFLTGLACIPMGSIWYVRNALLGHNIIDFPHISWLERARRSGDLMGWILLAGLLLLIYLYTRHQKPDWRGIVPGVLLILAGLVPSMPLINPTRIDPPQSYITLPEWTLVIVGSSLLVWTLYRYYRQQKLNPADQEPVHRYAWAILLILPYFITWFYSYSYHARLSFAIVPVLLTGPALVLANGLSGWLMQHRFRWLKPVYLLAIIGFSLPGVAVTIIGVDQYTDWLWTDHYPDDWSRYRVQNPSVVLMADYIRGYEAYHGIEPVVYAPGEQRLPFFFPEYAIINDTLPTRLDDIADGTHYVYGDQARWRYEEADILPEANQIVSSLGRQDIIHQALVHSEATFHYELYELQIPRRFRDLEPGEVYKFEDEVVYGDFARLIGFNATVRNLGGQRVFFDFLWETLAQTDTDYMMQLRLIHTETGETIVTRDRPFAAHTHGYYHTTLWQPGERIKDTFSFELQPDDGIIRGDFQMAIALYTQDETGQLRDSALTISGEPAKLFTLPGLFHYP